MGVKSNRGAADKHSFLISHLSLDPTQKTVYPLELLYDRQRGKGMFLYREQPVWMKGSYEEISHSSGYVFGESRTFKRFTRCKWLSCWRLASWLRDKPQCYSREDMAGEHNQWYGEDGFKFDEATQMWCNCWRYKEASDVYTTTHRTVAEVKLSFDAIANKGKYISYSCKETLD
ncbi:MAG: hypothetical protein SW833_00420 [Cyanobacteriota bacterium]|nr:hypothetical protein [Cyanobacteriota bacterium]